jgi:putative endonuclease
VTAARQSLGRHAEELVAARLRRQGMQILERNARVQALRGELDIVARDGPDLVFVEVKAIREGNRLGPTNPVEMVGPRKQARLRSLAAAWIGERRPGAAGGVRFDVIGVTVRASGSPARIEHLRGAF